jgi:hypothetical protein
VNVNMNIYANIKIIMNSLDSDCYDSPRSTLNIKCTLYA